MKLTLLAALAAGVFAVNAQATQIDWGTHGELQLAAVVVNNSGAFVDKISFSIPSVSNISSTAVSNNLLNVLNINDGMIDLVQVSDGGDVDLATYSFDGTTGSTAHDFGPLTAGNYYYQISGTATGTGGPSGFYSLSSTLTPAAPVPEPESYAMLLAGLGVVGSLYRRRKAG